ncbi:MAG: hypothetical protein OEV37_03670 [Candidatus Berkelbacteria bacterium]|nr:hypothetical protein [Candidatus Berkelbacteria bacterium]
MIKKLCALVFMLLIFPVAAQAAEIRTGETLSVSEAAKNVYLFASSISTIAETKGDLVAFANSIDISKPVEQSLFVAGNTIKVGTDIGNSVRAFGSSVTFEGKAGGDVILFGATVTIPEGTIIEGDLIAFGNLVTVGGNVNGAIKIYAASAVINASVGRDLEIHSDNITIGEKTVVAGKLTYYSAKEAKISDKAKITGAVERKDVPEAKTGFKALATSSGWYNLIASLLAVIVFAIVLTYLAPGFVRTTVEEAIKSPAKPLWQGFVALIVVPIIAIILFITVIGGILGLSLLAVYAAALIIAYALSAVITGTYLNRLINKSKTTQADWVGCVFGAVALAIIGWIPYIGPIVKFLIYLIALGALISHLVGKLRPAK